VGGCVYVYVVLVCVWNTIFNCILPARINARYYPLPPMVACCLLGDEVFSIPPLPLRGGGGRKKLPATRRLLCGLRSATFACVCGCVCACVCVCGPVGYPQCSGRKINLLSLPRKILLSY
jgi:hypothetical protein